MIGVYDHRYLAITLMWFAACTKPAKHVATTQTPHVQRAILPRVELLPPSVDAAEAISITISNQRCLISYRGRDADPDQTDLVAPVGVPVRITFTSDQLHRLRISDLPGPIEVSVAQSPALVVRFNEQTDLDWSCPLNSDEAVAANTHTLHAMRVQDFQHIVEELNEKNDPQKIENIIALGRRLSVRFACRACHTIDGAPGAGPSWFNLFGQAHLLSDGRMVTVDEAFIRDSILTPHAAIASGYNTAMPAFALRNKEIAALTQYIKSLAQPPTDSRAK